MQVVAETGTADEVLAGLRRADVDVVVLDLGMPGTNGVDLLDRIRREWPALPVLVLTVYPEDLYAVRALRAGAAGYLTKDSAAEELIQAIQRVRAGRRWVSPRLAEHLAALLERDPDRPAHDALSNREFEVLRRIGAGQTATLISRSLHLSPKTVSTYRARILEKLDLRTTSDLIRYALKHGLTD
jgi:DNA-binding NarL/FixJ family response regulator